MHFMQHQKPSLSALLFPGYRRALLGMLFLHPEESLHAREIARRAQLPAGSAIRELNRLANVGLLAREKRGNQTIYSANRGSPVFEEIASILRKTSGLADMLKAALAPLADRIDVAFVFGSIAKGTETAGSDIDVLLIGTIDFGRIVETLYPVQAQLGREINPKVFSTKEWRSKLKVKDPFVMDVLSKAKIFLVGDNDGLGKLGW